MFGRFSKRYAESKALAFTPETVVKTIDPTHAPVEAEVTRLAQAVGVKTGLFRVPRVLAHDADTGSITFERLHGLVTLGQFLAGDRDGHELLARAGEAIAAVHAHMCLPAPLKFAAPASLQSDPSDEVAIHGDFNTLNSCYIPDADELVLLDWSTAPALSEKITTGSRYIDLAQFVRSLLIHQAGHIRACKLFSNRSRAFLAGYQRRAGLSVDMDALTRFLLKISFHHMKHQFSWPGSMGKLSQAANCLAGHVALAAFGAKWLGNPIDPNSCLKETRKWA